MTTKVITNTRLSPEVKEELEAIAKKNELSVTYVIRKIIVDCLNTERYTSLGLFPRDPTEKETAEIEEINSYNKKVVQENEAYGRNTPLREMPKKKAF